MGSDRIPGTTGMRTGVASRPRGVLGADGGLMASNRPPDDVLGGLPVERVAAWYRRLAAYSDAKAAEAHIRPSIAAMTLNHWLDGRKHNAPTLRFVAPTHLKSCSAVVDTLRYHRRVYLSQERARTPGGSRIVGIAPRMKDPASHGIADPTAPITMSYHSLVEVANGWNWFRLSDAEKDVFTGLGGFQLHTEVVVRVTPDPAGARRGTVNILSWAAWVADRYDWNYSEHLTMPNPDHGSRAADAVAPHAESIRVYHTNARRLEMADLASPYDLESEKWSDVEPALVQPAHIAW